jgi:hypothetical protein
LERVKDQENVGNRKIIMSDEDEDEDEDEVRHRIVKG